jgi:hypothetical protein
MLFVKTRMVNKVFSRRTAVLWYFENANPKYNVVHQRTTQTFSIEYLNMQVYKLKK